MDKNMKTYTTYGINQSKIKTHLIVCNNVFKFYIYNNGFSITNISRRLYRAENMPSNVQLCPANIIWQPTPGLADL